MATKRITTYAEISAALKGLIGSLVELETTFNRRPGDRARVVAVAYLGEPENTRTACPLYELHVACGVSRITVTFAPHDVRVMRTTTRTSGPRAFIALAA